MNTFRILIVEDEVLISDTIARYLHKNDHTIVGQAISVAEAKELFDLHLPDLVLIDIRLNGPETGIDLAKYIQRHGHPKPFIFLTSQVDSQSIHEAKATFPAGYLTKPIQKFTLFSTIEIAMHNYQAQEKAKETIRLYNGQQYYQVPVDDILYMRADRNYIHFCLTDNKSVTQRSSLRETLDQLPDGRFVQTHRSYAVNLQKVSRWDSEYLYVDGDPVPISRSRRKAIIDMLQTG
jgi:two-component system response regulator LytT